MKKSLTIALIIILSSTVLAIAAQNKDTVFVPPPPTEEQKRNAEKYREEREKYGHLPDCEGTINVKLGPHVLTVPRTWGTFLTKNNSKEYYSSLNRPSSKAECKKVFFDDIAEISMLAGATPPEIGVLHITYSPEGDHVNYNSTMQAINRQQAELQFKKMTLNNGLTLYQSQNGEGNLKYYVFPKNSSLNPLKPMSVQCWSTRKFSCTATHVLPNGLALRYEIHNKPDEFFLRKQEAEDFVMGLISSQPEGDE